MVCAFPLSAESFISFPRHVVMHLQRERSRSYHLPCTVQDVVIAPTTLVRGAIMTTRVIIEKHWSFRHPPALVR